MLGAPGQHSSLGDDHDIATALSVGERVIDPPQHRFTAGAAAAALPPQTADTLRFVTLLQRGTLSVELYAPQGGDRQTPHDQDELYVVISGHGEFLNGDERHPLWTADLVIHRWHRLPAHSRRGLVSPRRRLVAEESVVRRRARATPTKSNGPEIGIICGQQIWSSTDGTDCRPIPAAA
jgi:hypothetical protein